MPILKRSSLGTGRASSRTPQTGGARSRKWGMIVKNALTVGAGIGIVGFLCFTVIAAWISRDLPDPNSLTTRDVPQSTKIYDRTGTHLLYEIHGEEKRTLIKIEDLPRYVPMATVSIEDKKFYEHHGIYWRGLVRAVVMSVFKGQRIQGTSTLTQQLMKNVFLDNRRSPLRKMKEFILSLQIERKYSKEQILQMYLNEIPYGSTIYGIESAAQSYFGKSAKDLTIDEAALLSALPQAPDLYSPYGNGSRGDNRDLLVGRQHHILDLMAEQGYITTDQAEASKQIDTLQKLQPQRIGGIHAPHFVMYVRSLLIETYGQKKVEQGGLRVTTTLDWDMQEAAEEEVAKGVEARGKTYGFTNGALVALDPKTGHILSMVGSKDFFDKENDGQVNVTLRPRQPGSSFKPIVYAAGFIKGFLPETTLWDVRTLFKTDTKDYAPQNYSGDERGPISVRMALQGSLNIPAVKMLYLVGVGRALDFAESLGYTTFGARNRFGLALVLGGGEVLPLEHAAAFATFANDGVAHKPQAVLKIEEADGTVLEEWAPDSGERVVEPQIAHLLSNVLSDNEARSYVFQTNNRLTLPDRPVAAKTGTTNDYHDAWTVGYTPSIATVVWVGNNDNSAMKRGADGSVVAAPIWQGFMRRATQGTTVERFPEPEPPKTDKPALRGQATEELVRIDRVSGKRATEFTPPDLVDERTFFVPHSILFYVDRDDPTGPAPTNPALDPQFTHWESAVQTWVQTNAWHTTSTAPTEFDDVHTAENQPTVTILEPRPGQLLQDRYIPIRLDIHASRAIKTASFSIDGSPIGSIRPPINDARIHIPNTIENGTHNLTIKVVDDVGNAVEQSTEIQLFAQKDAVSALSILFPVQNTAWSSTTFPQDVTIQIENPTQYTRVDILLESQGSARLVASELLPEQNILHLTIPSPPANGTYTLRARTTSKDGSSHAEEAFTTIIVTP